MRLTRAFALTASFLALAVGVAGAANPPRPTGGLRFSPATPVDAQRSAAAAAVEDDASGGFWIGARGAPALVRRSVDGGDTFHATTPLAGTAGGVDIEVDDRGIAYASFRGGKDAVGTALSVDGGHTWGQASFPVSGPVDERVSVAVDSGIAGDPSDDGVFVAFRTDRGAFVYSSGTSGGLPYENAGRSSQPLSTGERCGRLVFDPFRRRLYLPCVDGGAIELVVASVPLGRRTGIDFALAGALTETGVEGIPAVAADGSGTVYAVWVGSDHDVHHAASRDGGASWGSAAQVSGAGAESNALPAAVGGVDGSLAIAWLGLDAEGRDPRTLPSLSADPKGASAFRWYVYAALVTGAASQTPSIFQQRVTAKPVHYGRICTDCAGGDPIVGDSLGLALDRTLGAMTVVFADTTGADHAPQLYAARQLEGPTALGQSIVKPVPGNPLGDYEGDAPWPAFSPSGGGPNQPQLDLTRVELGQPSPPVLRVRMTVASLGGRIGPPPGKAAAVWLTRFQVLARGAAGEDVYRTVYVGATSAAGAPPTFFAGATTCGSPCALLEYPPTVPATGSVSGNDVVIDVRLADGFGRGVELSGDRLLDVSGHTFGRDSVGDVYADVDATRAFDYRLDQRIGPTTGRGRRITLSGAIRATGTSRGSATVDVYENKTGRVSYRDAAAALAFRSTSIARVTVRAGTATISGTGLNGARRVSFVATLVDRGPGGRRDSFGLRLSSGYRKSGRLLSGDVRIRASSS